MMSPGVNQLLPGSSKGFAKPEYWDSFFLKLRNNFEWYGNYEELSPILHKYLSDKDKLLIVGCGNSDLSNKLYWAGIRDQISMDISEVAIDKMKDLYPRQDFRVGDVTKMEFMESTFSCILDKGTFDALTPPPTKDEKDKMELENVSSVLDLIHYSTPVKMLQEVSRVIKPRGRFLCVSLLQDHVAELLLKYFHKEGWMIRICRCPKAIETEEIDDNLLSVYLCVFTKMNLPGVAPIEFCASDNINAKPDRMTSIEDLLTGLKDITNNAFMRKTVRKLGSCTISDEDTVFTLTNTNGNVRYIAYVIDLPKFFKNPPEKQFGIFIIPQGREIEYSFGSREGRLTLAQHSGFSRLVVIELVRGETYGNMFQVQLEVSDNVKFLLPDSVAGTGIQSPIMTVGDDIGERNLVYEGSSEFSGKFVVEDINSKSEVLRRLIFLNAPSVIQSEILMVHKKKRRSGKGKAASNTKELEPLTSKVQSPYHAVLVIGYGMLKHFLKTEERKTLLIGLGGGLLVSYLCHLMPDLPITAIEIDPEIVKVAKNYFGLPPYGEQENFQVVVEDGLKYISETESKYNLIIFDVDNKGVTEGLSCPPPEFITPSFLQVTKDRLLPEGIFVLNLVCRNRALKQTILDDVAKVFDYIYHYDVQDDMNTLVFCFPSIPSGGNKSHVALLAKSIRFQNDLDRGLTNRPLKSKDEISNVGDEVGIENMSRLFKIIREGVAVKK